jgi:double-stranded uracil-DNA glycosylase
MTVTTAAAPDAAVPDAAVPDAAVPDAAVPDAAVPDAAVPDAAVPDAAVPDAGTPAADIRRPSAADLVAARGRRIPDLVVPGLRVLFAGINPSLYSAATGYHFARPGNRFWPALHQSGFTPRQLRPAEQYLLPGLGLGITNVVARATARADELDAAELREGGALLAAITADLGAVWLAVLGVTAYRTGFGLPGAVVGPQDERIGGARVWVLPNPSGLNAHWSGPRLGEAFSVLRAAAFGGARSPA